MEFEQPSSPEQLLNQTDIYCHGPLLEAVQMARVFNDSKTFVDMKMKQSPNETMELFVKFMDDKNNTPSRDDIVQWVHQTFDPPGSEFETYTPSDWVPNPKYLEGVVDSDFRKWGHDLNDLWLKLGRKMKDNVKENPELYSIVHVENPVIVPGGRFREFYYWDSYWIIRGLLLSEMHDTVKGMLLNFLSIVKSFGFIPNGGRIYYSMRSQPPLLAGMVQAYVDSTKDYSFIETCVDTLDTEFKFWIENRTENVIVNGKSHMLAVYRDISNGPRPESYREDIEAAEHFASASEKNDFYRELKSAAESGWDFSTRWFISSNGTNEGTLTNLKTKYIVPVDLNAIMYWNANILSEFYKYLNNTEKSEKYANIASQWKESIQELLWNEELGVWLDYDLLNRKPREYFYPTNIAPLWTNCYDLDRKEEIVQKVISYLSQVTALDHPGGVPSSMEQSGEQWDYPNAWPPLQYIMIFGLDNTGIDSAKTLAYELSTRWVRSNYKAYIETKAMYEKYDATLPGGHGGGGEYDVQLGFGWTNGIVMDLLARYGDKMMLDDPVDSGASIPIGQGLKGAGAVTLLSTVATILT